MNPSTHHFNFTSEELNNFLKIAGAVALGVLTLFLLVKTINEVKVYSTIGDNPNGMQNVISVTGKSDMEVMPDVTVFSWSIEADGKTSQESESKSATINNKAIAFAKEKGIPEADIKTTGLNTYAKYGSSYKNCIVPVPAKGGAAGTDAAMVSSPAMYPYPCNPDSVVTGYTTSQSVQVKVRDVNKNKELVEQLVAGLTTTGVRVSTPTSSIDDVDVYKRLVRNEAIVKARQEAEVLAQSLGVKLVRIASFNENGGGYYPYAMDSMSARPAMNKAEVIPDLPTGTNNVSAEVTITYEIR
jgi:uncharacterized protein YggE